MGSPAERGPPGRTGRPGHRRGQPGRHRLRDGSPARRGRCDGRDRVDDGPHPRAGRRAQAAGLDASGHVGDLMVGGAAGRLVAEALRSHDGRLDILVNNAGMVAVGTAEESSEVEAMDPAEWDRGIARNLGVAFRVTRAALPALIASGRGRIVFVSSVTGPLVSNPGSAVYGAAKAGVARAHARAGDRGRPTGRHRERRPAGLDRHRLAAARGGDRRARTRRSDGPAPRPRSPRSSRSSPRTARAT